MDPLSLTLAVVAGLLIGFSMGTVGGGGAIMAVPVLVYGLAQSPVQATTASLVIVGVTAVQGAIAAARRGAARISEGVGFGVAAVAGAIVGAIVAHQIAERWLMAGFVLVLVITAVLQVRKLVRARKSDEPPAPHTSEPMLSFGPFHADWPRLATFFGVATVVGFVTGLLGVGGGFMIVPALTLVLGMTMHRAAGTSLVVMVVTSLAALTTRLLDGGLGVAPSWTPVLVMTGCALVGSFVGGRVAHKADARTLAIGFTTLICVIAIYTLVRLVPQFV